MYPLTPRGEGDIIRLGTKVSSFAAVAIFAVAAGGISAALLVPDGGQSGNIITAGHLQVQINQGDGSDIAINDLMPGETRTAYQLVSGDMEGVGTADLTMTLSPPTQATPFTQYATLALAVSQPLVNAVGGAVSEQTCSALDDSDFSVTMQPTPLSSPPAASTVSLARFDATTGTDAVCVRFTVGLSAQAGNPVQGTDGTFAFAYDLEQTSAVTS